MEILNELRKATGPIHTRIEELPICKGLLAGTVDRLAYARLLSLLQPLHESFESALNEVSALTGIWPSTPSRAAALGRDLAVFGTELEPAIEAVRDWFDGLQSLGHPAAWAGAGYVFEGSRMGSRVLVKCVAQAFHIPLQMGAGLDYHLDSGEDPTGNWKRVMGALAAADHGSEARAAMIDAAVRTFEVIYALHELAGEPVESLEMVG